VYRTSLQRERPGLGGGEVIDAHVQPVPGLGAGNADRLHECAGELACRGRPGEPSLVTVSCSPLPHYAIFCHKTNVSSHFMSCDLMSSHDIKKSHVVLCNLMKTHDIL